MTQEEMVRAVAGAFVNAGTPEDADIMRIIWHGTVRCWDYSLSMRYGGRSDERIAVTFYDGNEWRYGTATVRRVGGLGAPWSAELFAWDEHPRSIGGGSWL
jgi:hypothetical protein